MTKRGAALPTRPKASPAIIPGTSIRRTYVAPHSLDVPQLGDIVFYDHHQWDVVGSHALAQPDEAGYQPLSLMLERIERPLGKKKVVREHADSRDVVLLARQVLLPGAPTPPVPDRPADRG